MRILIVLVCILIQNFCFAQADSVIFKKKYLNGKLRYIELKRGRDSLIYKYYYPNGELKFTYYYHISGGEKKASGIHREYYNNGKLASVICYGKKEVVRYSYRKNGKLSSSVRNPEGPDTFYNKKGKMIAETNPIYLRFRTAPWRYKHKRHLINTSFESRIKSSDAQLILNNKKKKLVSGVLISLILINDSNLIKFCQIEGFSKDTIYLTRFSYKESYYNSKGDADTTYGLNYDSIFALAIDQIKSINYSRYNTAQRLEIANSLGQISTLSTAFMLMRIQEYAMRKILVQRIPFISVINSSCYLQRN